MLVRAIVTHYHKHLRIEGAEFEHDGPLYEHIEPVEPEPEPDRARNGRRRSKAASEDSNE